MATGETSGLVLRDTPAGRSNIPDCLARHKAVRRAARARAKAIEADPLADAARADNRGGRVRVLDINNLICDRVPCRVTVGRLIVYFDRGHMTETFAATLVPEVSSAMLSALGPRK